MAWPDARSRPRPITLIGWIFIAVGAAGILRYVLDSQAQNPSELGVAYASSLLAVIGGAGLLRGLNWAQWFLVGFFLLFVVYAFVLLTVPSAVGRGGR